MPGARGIYVLGYLRGGRVPGLDCDQPLQWVCRDCGGLGKRACNGHRSTACAPCAERYRRRVVRIAEAGMDKHATAGFYLYMVTFTAPSQDEHRQWSLDPAVRGDARPMCGCPSHVQDGLDVWNGSAGKRWNHLRTALTRDYEGLKFFRAAEPQDGKRRTDGRARNALHHHTLVASPEPLDSIGVQRHALAAGYGCVVDFAPITDQRRVAYYVSKYVTKGCDSRENVPWRVPTVDRETGEMAMTSTVPTYRTWSASRTWGLTMKEIRAALAHSARLRAAALVQLVPADSASPPPALPEPASGAPPPAP